MRRAFGREAAKAAWEQGRAGLEAKAVLYRWGEPAGEAFFRQSLRAVSTILAKHGVTEFSSEVFGECAGLVFGIVTGAVDLATGELDVENGGDGLRAWIARNDVDARADLVGRLVIRDMARGRRDFMEG